MTVYRRKDRGNAWAYDFVRKGERFRGLCLDDKGRAVTSKTAAREAEARVQAESRQAAAVRRSGIQEGRYPIGLAAAAWLARKQGRKPNHVRNTRLYVAELLAFFGPATPMNEIDDERIAAYARHTARQTTRKWKAGGQKLADVADPADAANWHDTGRPRSTRTANNYLKALRSLFAIAGRIRDPVTRQPVVDRVPEIALLKVPRRLPRPMPDQELHQRLAAAEGRPWAQEAAELARLFGLRLAEALQLERRHIDHQARALLFSAGDTKSGNDEPAFGGDAGWQLLQRLEAQATQRGTPYLVTWPGKDWQAWSLGRAVEGLTWQPLKSIRTSWRRTATAAGVDAPHRFHDVRARYITEVAKVQSAAAQGAARHQDPATTALYVRLAASEIAGAVSRATDLRPIAPTVAPNAVRPVGDPVVNRGVKRAKTGPG